MITGGNALVFVSNLDTSVRFYTEVLGLRLTYRFGDHWATVEAGPGLLIGLHPIDAKYPAPGTKGAIMLGMDINEPIDRVIARLMENGVKVLGPVTRAEVGAFVHIEDPDGNEIVFWEKTPDYRIAIEPEAQPALSTASR